MSQITISEGSAMDRIMKDPELARARQKLSFHDFKMIIDHVKAAMAAQSLLRLETCAMLDINGVHTEWSGDQISHEEICGLAQQPIHASVTYSGPKNGDSQRSGTTYAGKTIAVEDGMRISCVVTGSA